MVITKFKQLIGVITNQLSRYKKTVTALLLLLIVGCIYIYPQQFTDLWLTKNQQARILFYQGNYQQAAEVFRNQRWRAYSHYHNGNFGESATIYDYYKGVDELFAKANALAHAGKYYSARRAYNQVIEIESKHHGARSNWQLVSQIIHKLEGMAKIAAANSGALSGSKNDDETENDEIEEMEEMEEMDEELLKQLKELLEEKKKQKHVYDPISNELWLEQINKNPAAFLKNKFHLEYAAEKKLSSGADAQGKGNNK